MDDVDDDALPGQAARGTALRLYYHLRLVYVLGFLEALLGASIVVLEAAGTVALLTLSLRMRT